MRAMTGLDGTRRRDLRLATWTGTIATALFLALSWLTTQVESIRAAFPFTEDPYDAVVSFGVIAIAVIGGATAFRAIVHARGPYDPSVARRIAIGVALATLIAAVALVSDAVAMIAGPIDLAAPGVGIVLVMFATAAGTTVVALACIVRARAALLHPAASTDAEPDMLDELGSIVGSVGAARAADGLAGWVERSALSPRRHRVLVGVLGGIAAGVAAVAWHAMREGPWASPAAAMLFGTLMAVGVAGAYLACLAPLRLLRPARGD
jgi:hypothetical protein